MHFAQFKSCFLLLHNSSIHFRQSIPITLFIFAASVGDLAR